MEGGRGRKEGGEGGKGGRGRKEGREDGKGGRGSKEGGRREKEDEGRKREEGGRGKWVKGGREKRKLISKKITMAEDQFKCTCTCRYMNNQ